MLPDNADVAHRVFGRLKFRLADRRESAESTDSNASAAAPEGDRYKRYVTIRMAGVQAVRSLFRDIAVLIIASGQTVARSVIDKIHFIVHTSSNQAFATILIRCSSSISSNAIQITL